MSIPSLSDSIFLKQTELENKKNQYKQERRLLIWYGNTIVVVLILFIICIFVAGFLNIAYYSIFAGLVAVLLCIVLIFLTIYFFVNYADYDGTQHGFKGIERIKNLISLRTEIEDLKTQITVLEIYQTQQLEYQERYKNQLPQLITQYQHQANRYRRLHYTIQINIILLSLLVSGLTSGFSGLIGIFGKPWIAPALSLSVSFLTSLTILFRFHDRGFNLQQTADSIEFEIHASELRIFDYKGLTNEEALRELAERTERLRNEQRKRQQQLEQASQTRSTSE